MRNFTNIMTIVFGILTISCSTENSKTPKPQKTAVSKETVKQKSQETTAFKDTLNQKSPEKKTGESNVIEDAFTFNVPKQFQTKINLKTTPLLKDANGQIKVPNISIQDFNGKTSIFLSVGNDKFVLRHIEVKQRNDIHSIVEKNVLENEAIVTNGVQQLSKALMRVMSGSGGHGHSH